jgi:hypothetical protein
MRAPLHSIRPGLLVLLLISFGVGSRAIGKPNALEILVLGSLGNITDPGVWRNYGFGDANRRSKFYLPRGAIGFSSRMRKNR